MANGRNKAAKTIKGRNVYYYKERDEIIYYDPISKKPYIVTDRNAYIFSILQLRFPFALIIIGLLMLFTKNMTLAVLVAAGAFVIATLVIRLKLLKDQPYNESFKKPESQGFIKDIAHRYTTYSLIVTCILFCSIALSLIINLIFRGAEGKARIIVISLICLSLIVSLFIIYIISLQKKESRK